MLNLFGSRKPDTQRAILAFEYGVVLARTAIEQGIELTPELVKKAEVMIEGEFSTKTIDNLAGQMLPNIMSVFELDTTK